MGGRGRDAAHMARARANARLWRRQGKVQQARELLVGLRVVYGRV
jgi:hypothetical protein